MTNLSVARPELVALKAYQVPDSQGMVKLDAMENPYLWPEELSAEWSSALTTLPLNRYPDADSAELKETIRESMGIPDHLSLILGNGSDEIIQMLSLLLAKPGAKVLSPTPSFVMYGMSAMIAGMEFVGVPLYAKDDFALDLTQMLAAIELHQPALIYLSYPNNPTGNLFDKQAMIQIIEAAPGLVVVEEAYQPFAGDSFLPLVSAYENVLLMRTLSKLGLAGLRLGFAVAHRKWINALNNLRMPYNINTLTQYTANFALKNISVFDQQAKLIVAQREILTGALVSRGLKVFPSAANFILVKVGAGQADAIYAGLKSRQVLIKNLHQADSETEDCIRVSIGKASECSQFLIAYDDVMSVICG